MSPAALRDMGSDGERALFPATTGAKSVQSSTWASSSLRNRPLARPSPLGEVLHPLRHRRSSTFSDSVDDARQSIKSSTDDLLLPKVRNDGLSHEPSHWHSLPLVLALLPAIAGLLFPNGGAVVTDVTLLAVAAIFLNWSVRLPWQWYVSAQSSQQAEPTGTRGLTSNEAIIEEDGEDEAGQIPESEKREQAQDNPAKATAQSQIPLDAEAELRIHELLALLACFMFPIIGAWLLHHIRAQLSRPSEGLISNYNLTIFLFASEIRPLSHLVKMIQARTLYLQRTVTIDIQEEESTKLDLNTLTDLSSRLNELEAHVANKLAATSTDDRPAQKQQQRQQIATEVRKTLQPDLDALNRAVRRYEKKATILSIQTESRLQDLESRMSDAITLAAAAERSISRSHLKRGSSVLVLMDWISKATLLPLQAAWAVATFPARLAEGVWTIVEQYIGNKIRREMKTAGRGGTGGGHVRKTPLPPPSGSRGGKKMR